MTRLNALSNFKRQIDVIGLGLIIVVLLHIVYSWGYEKYEAYGKAITKAKLLTETDPLRISTTSTSPQIVECGGIVELPRHVILSKPLTVTVRRSMELLGSGERISYNLPDVVYSEIKPIEANINYKVRIPESMLKGNYLYRPILKYKVNKYLTITKPAPTQYFTVMECLDD